MPNCSKGPVLRFSVLSANECPPNCDAILASIEVGARDTTYEPPERTLWGYDGPDYCITVERSDGTFTLLKYYPWVLPSHLKAVHFLLDSLAEKSQGNHIQRFDYLLTTNRVARCDSVRLRSFAKIVRGEPVPVPD